MLPERLQKFATNPIPVLNDGSVMLLDVMGDDHDIVDAARVSYGAGTKRVSEDRHLIRYLMRHGHTSPFEMCEIKLRVRVPMDCWRHWIRHRTASVNEYSTRYSEAIDSAQVSSEWRAQAKDNKQGSNGVVTQWPEGFEIPGYLGTLFPAEELDSLTPGAFLTRREESLQKFAREVYKERLTLGVAREVARKDLPLSTYTEAYWKCDLHNLLHFLKLRLDPHAQEEIRLYAEAIAQIVKVWVPWAWEAFEDYRLGSMTFSKKEIEGLSVIMELALARHSLDEVFALATKTSGLKGRELAEFEAKIKRIRGS